MHFSKGSGEVRNMRRAGSGCGIPQKDLPQIFNRFYQVDKSKSEKQGAGLGLAIAQKILHLQGADIIVGIIENQGTTFRVAIPGNGF